MTLALGSRQLTQTAPPRGHVVGFGGGGDERLQGARTLTHPARARALERKGTPEGHGPQEENAARLGPGVAGD